MKVAYSRCSFSTLFLPGPFWPIPWASSGCFGRASWHPAHTTWPRVGALSTATKRSPQPLWAALVLTTFAWVLMHFINQAGGKLVFSPGVELNWVSQESDDFQSWCKGGGRTPHPGERQEWWDGGQGVSPPTARLAYPSWVDLFCLKKHCFLTVLWEILGVPMLELCFYIGDCKSLTRTLSASCAIWTHTNI